MSAQRIAFALSMLCCAHLARADELTIPLPAEKWSLKLDAPAMQKAPVAGDDAVYAGTAGKWNVSLHVGPPLCAGGDGNENMYKCFGAKMQQMPYIVNGSIRANETPRGVQVAYLMELPLGERKVRAFNINYLFAKNGKWADLHISVIQPAKEDFEAVFKMLDTVAVIDQAPAS